MSKYSLDEENQRMYGQRAKEWDEKAEGYRRLSDAVPAPDKKAAETVEKSGGSGIIDIKELNTFKNEMQKLGITDLQGFEEYQGDPQILQEMVEDFGRMKTVFPKLFSGFDKISLSEQHESEYAFYDTNKNYFNFNSSVYNDSKLLCSSYQNDVDNNFHPAGTTYRANVFHEFGHLVETFAGINPKKLAKSIFQKQKGRFFQDRWVMNGLHKICVYMLLMVIMMNSFPSVLLSILEVKIQEVFQLIL